MILDHSKLLMQDKVKFSSFCLNPSIVWNPYQADFVLAECRKCVACRNRRAERLARLLDMECKQHPYCIFFTLTYRNADIPLLELHEDDKGQWYESSRDNIILDDVHKVDAPFIRKKKGKHSFEYLYGKIGVVNVRDIQLFNKRLRKYISTHFEDVPEEKRRYRYFIAAEYGPDSFRPHYHGILFVDEKKIADALLSKRYSKVDGQPENIIHKTWKMCSLDRIKPSIIKGSASRYVTSYFDSFSSLPEVLSVKPFRPFYLCSRKPFIGFSQVDESEWLGRLMSGDTKDVYTDPKTLASSYVPLSLSVLAHFFPLPAGNSQTTDTSKLSLYYKYKSCRYTKESEYNEETEKGNLRDLSPLGKHHLTDAYNYQDFRFFMGVEFWCNQPRKYKEFVDGRWTGNVYETTLRPMEYIRLLTKLYESRNYFNLCKFLYEVDKKNRMFMNHPTFVDLCKKYDLNPEQWVNAFHYPLPFQLLPESGVYYKIKSSDAFQRLKSLPFIRLQDLYDKRGFNAYVIRKDLVSFIVGLNPIKHREAAALSDLMFKKTCRKRHLSHFNESF